MPVEVYLHPNLLDPNFAKSILYFCSLRRSRKPRVILNRPQVRLCAKLIYLLRKYFEDLPVFEGGPVEKIN